MKQLPLPGSNQGTTSFTTIDDAIQLSQELLARLSKIGEHKYPLAVRRGVKTMADKNDSKTVRAGSITYFLDLKETKDNKPFLVITESRFKGENENRARKTIVVFQENVKEFAQAVVEMATKLE